MLGSILTRQYRFATRGIQFTLQTARVAVDIAEGVVGEVAGRLGLHNGHDEPDVVNGTVVPDAEPRPEPPEPRPAPRDEPAPPSPAAPHGDPVAGSPAASSPAPPASAASPAPPASAASPGPAAPPVPPVEAAPPSPLAEPSPAPLAEPTPAHVSSEPELVEEFSEPGAEDGAGAQVRIEEPWEGYRHLKARDIIARLASASREELAAVELFELAGANRKSVVVAAQRALQKASPPRGTIDQ